MQIDQAVLVAPGVPLAWHEAVALVSAVVDALEERRIRAVPSLEDLALDLTGAVRLPSANGTGGSEAAMVAELRNLLGHMLDTAAPAPLRALAEGSDPVASVTLAEFRRALTFFERPPREQHLQALAARLAAKQEEQRVISEMERLTHKARAHGQAPDATPAPVPVPGKTRWKSRVVLATGGLALVVAAIVVVVMSGGTSAPSTLEPLRTAGTGVLKKLRVAAHSAFGSGGAPTARLQEVTPLTPKPAVKTVRRTATLRRTPERIAPAPRRVEIYRATEPEVVEVPLVGGLANEALPVLPTSSRIVFDRFSADVLPAQLLIPQLTAVAPQVFKGGSGALEVLVGEDGHVERVRLVATRAERRYYDAMILPAVKSWIFRPATRAGRPVRYQLRIPLT